MKNVSSYAVIWPASQNGNKYINILRRVANSLGYELIELRDIVKLQYLFKKIKWVNFNWYESLHTDSRLKACLKIIKRKSIVLFLKRIKKTKIIMTVHNKYEHNAVFPNYSKQLMIWLLGQADKIVVLCKETITYLEEFTSENGVADIKSKCVEAFHPNYIGAYEQELRGDFRIQRKPNEMVLLYFGSISSYKNVNMLIKLAEAVQSQNIKIVIAGSGNKLFWDKIFLDSAEWNNLILMPGFIPDEEIWGLIKQADCVVLPYNIDTVLNSGACMLALSAGKNVICPSFGTIKDFPEGLAYSYSYSEQQQHFQALYNKVMEAYEDYKNRNDFFIARCKALYRIVEEEYSVNKLEEVYKYLYAE